MTKNNRGFSLVSVMVGVGLIAIVAMGTLSLFENMNKSQNFQELRTQGDVFNEEIRAHLSDAIACKKTLATASLTNGAITNLPAILEASSAVKTALGSTYGNGTFKVTNIKFAYTPGDITTAGVTTGQGVLQIEMQAIKKVAGATQLRPREVAIRVTKNTATGALVECISMAKMTDGIWQRASTINDIYFAGGNVGVGITSPVDAFAVSGRITAANSAASPFNVIQLSVEAPDTGVVNYGHTSGTASGSLDLRVENVSRLHIEQNGNVGIGTISPAAKLDVQGELKVANTGQACTTTNEGSVRYNAALKNFEGCDGTIWKAFGVGNNCRWVNSNVDCTTGATHHQASCDPGESVNRIRTAQICFIADNTYTTISDLYCCK